MGATRTTPPRPLSLPPLHMSLVRGESALLRQHTLLARLSRNRERARCFSIDVTFDANVLRHTDPLALLLAPLAEFPAFRRQLGLLGTILSELYCNALEHGVLGLDSRGKRDAEGFERYVIEREERLSRLRHGWVRIAFTCSYEARRGVATIRVEDSGTGFDRMRLKVAAPNGARPDEPASSPALHGRGLAVIRSLGVRLYPGKGGRGVCALYRWNG